MPRRSLTAILAAGTLIAAALVPAAPALAGASAAVADCNAHGTLTRHYSAAQLRTALSTMPADIKEYTDCYDVINRALLAQVGSSRPARPAKASSSGGAFLPTPVIVVLVVLALAAAALGATALRRGGRSGQP